VERDEEIDFLRIHQETDLYKIASVLLLERNFSWIIKNSCAIVLRPLILIFVVSYELHREAICC